MNNFTILKNDNKKKDTEPDYRMNAKIGETWETIGACWLKDGQKGKYFSCQLQKPYNDKKGYVIEEMGDSSTPAVKPPINDSVADTRLSDGSDLKDIPF